MSDLIQSYQIVLIFLLYVGGAAVFCLPTIVAVRGEHPRRWVICAINLILGITVIGWFVALYWALHPGGQSREERPGTRQRVQDPGWRVFLRRLHVALAVLLTGWAVFISVLGILNTSSSAQIFISGLLPCLLYWLLAWFVRLILPKPRT